MENGKLIIVTAPSGAGKTTIGRHLLQTFPELAFSVSATSRAPRPHEVHGQDYYFYNEQDFLQLVEKDELLEWEEVYEGKFYGTLREEVKRLWGEQKHILFDIDVKGGDNLQHKYPDRTLSLFISPPSMLELKERLLKRRTESESSLRRRLERARFEMSYAERFDCVIVNDELSNALSQAEEKVRDFLY